ncbi:sugar phosphate isomerase/epimerase [Sphingomonas sp. LaA6.9]|uniref:sugar phosphate isomerase/epimerase family protein n=1 Tax=Sphingomonas sp. LaA6.9 TaxID=2919914 RepID=UPI001F4F892B|nr:sugar phosphate isomerase/epimerase [Sphingomonas sp. LaA6.9]MCJ8156134.1 sugar phosphate isomerase/epimerase [Sphingomonas sp. LaA6.9]
MHPRVSLHQVCFIGESNTAFIDICRKIGVRNAVMVSPKLLAPDALGGVRSILAHGEPRIEALNHVFATFPDLSSDSGQASSTFLDVIDAAESLGARSIYLLTGGRGPLAWEEAADRFAALVAPGVAAARQRGIAVLIENASALYADIHIAHSLADTIALAERADTGVCIDLFACWAEASLKEHFRRVVPRLELVQVSDYVLGDRALPARAVPGDGVVPLERILGDILHTGYEGVFDIELIGPRIEAEGNVAAATRAAERVSGMLTKLGA